MQLCFVFLRSQFPQNIVFVVYNFLVRNVELSLAGKIHCRMYSIMPQSSVMQESPITRAVPIYNYDYLDHTHFKKPIVFPRKTVIRFKTTKNYRIAQWLCSLMYQSYRKDSVWIMSLDGNIQYNKGYLNLYNLYT